MNNMDALLTRPRSLATPGSKSDDSEVMRVGKYLMVARPAGMSSAPKTPGSRSWDLVIPDWLPTPRGSTPNRRTPSDESR